jgi:predicted nuclease of predicted toxin-antitoxin system
VKKRKLLLDSSAAARAVITRLRADGHDLLTIAERGADPGDAAILALAVAEGRIVITIDTDFGALVFRDGAPHVGVLRLKAASAAVLADRVSALIAAHGDDLDLGAFVTDDGDGVRVRRR